MRAGKGLLISTYGQDQAIADHLAAAEAQSLLKQGHDSMQVLSQVAEKQQTDALNVLSRLPKFIESLEIKNTQQAQSFIEGYAQALESSSSQSQQEQGKLFRQALMLLASPNGIALTTPEDILLQASQDIAQGSQANINLSAQKNIVVQAQSKISLFAAEQGFRAFAAKGKLELQAQDDAIEAIARKVIKLISTEGKIEIISPKEISLNAGGSQLKINADGVFATTGGKFESKAGQHVFTSGEIVNAELPKMPESGIYSMRFDLSQIFDANILKNMKYKLINHSKKIEAEYEFEQESSARVYSDSADNVELALIPGAYLTESNHESENLDSESLDDEEIVGCGCHEEDYDHSINQDENSVAWES